MSFNRPHLASPTYPHLRGTRAAKGATADFQLPGSTYAALYRPEREQPRPIRLPRLKSRCLNGDARKALTSGSRPTSAAIEAGARTSIATPGSRALNALKRHCDITASPTQL